MKMKEPLPLLLSGVVVDDDGHVLGYQNNAEGDPLLLSEPPTCQRLTDAIEDAARQRWADQRNAGG